MSSQWVDIFTLPPNISGFDEQSGEMEAVDVSKFERLCDLFFHVISFQSNINSETTNYMVSLVEWKGEKHLVFCNKYYPVMAIAKVLESVRTDEVLSDLPKNEFIDDAPLKAQWFKHDFILLDKQYLEYKIDGHDETSQVMVKHLTDTEFAEFTFYEPKIMANIIFNRWEK